MNGENSDINICALGEEWNLHKIYLCQVRINYFPQPNLPVFPLLVDRVTILKYFKEQQYRTIFCIPFIFKPKYNDGIYMELITYKCMFKKDQRVFVVFMLTEVTFPPSVPCEVATVLPDR